MISENVCAMIVWSCERHDDEILFTESSSGGTFDILVKPLDTTVPCHVTGSIVSVDPVFEIVLIQKEICRPFLRRDPACLQGDRWAAY